MASVTSPVATALRVHDVIRQVPRRVAAESFAISFPDAALFLHKQPVPVDIPIST
jgi:hypothetical protein